MHSELLINFLHNLFHTGEYISISRESNCGFEGYECNSHYSPEEIAQLVRVTACHAVGCGFDSRFFRIYCCE
jgi:hypothetical protein